MILAWHAYHDGSSPLFFIESFDSRMNTIDTVKALKETPAQIARRKQLFKLFEGELPAELVKAIADYDKVWNDHLKMVNYKTWFDFYRTMADALPEILALHKTQCGCGWTPKNTNIFEYE